MPYDERIEARISRHITGWKNTNAKKMFGGICHLLNGNMFCGVYKEFLILRLGEKEAAKALSRPHTRPFDTTGRPMKGWIMVEGEGFSSDEGLAAWLEKARAFAAKLPPKT